MESSTHQTSQQTPTKGSRRRVAPRGGSSRLASEHLLEEQMLRAIAHYLRSGSTGAH